MNYRVATQEDLPVLLQFGEQLALIEAKFDETVGYEEEKVQARYTKQLANPLALFLIAETEESQSVGYLYAHVDPLDHIQQGEIEVVFIREEYRRQGIAQELIRRVLQWMKAHQVIRVVTHIFAENQSSRKTFERLGFESHNIEYLLKIK